MNITRTRPLSCGIRTALLILSLLTCAGFLIPAQRLAAATDPPPKAVFYTYDEAGRLSMVDYGGVALIYTYDANGNLLKLTVRSSLYLPLALRSYTGGTR